MSRKLFILCMIMAAALASAPLYAQDKSFNGKASSNKTMLIGENAELLSRRLQLRLDSVNLDSINTEELRIPLIFSDYYKLKPFEAPFPFASSSKNYLPSLSLPESPLAADNRRRNFFRKLRHEYMLTHLADIRYLAWTLPDPPQLKSTPDNSRDYLIANITPPALDDIPPALLDDIDHINWLHKFDGGVQFSQAYLSPNWYQGGSNNLSLLVNLLWDVVLNEVYHPNILFTNSLNYKLGLYSTPNDEYHEYSISQDLFQWNMKAGLRARNKWFYSFTTQFKTQFLNNYGENSLIRKASFFSPGELNVGLGMTYSTTSRNKRFKFNASISPASYNLKVCLDRAVDPTQFSIPEGKKIYNQIGSNAEATAEWNITGNISWRSRFFIFTNYQTMQSDWENTFNFAINRFLSTQIYVHARYDSSATPSANWRYWMLKEILSFGFRYAFSTK